MDPTIQKRIAAVRKTLVARDLDALMVSIQENRYYLSGYSGEDTQFDESAGVLLISGSQRQLVTDSRYALQAQKEAEGFEVILSRNGLETDLVDVVCDAGIRRLGFESVRVTHKAFASLTRGLKKRNPSVELIPAVDIVESLRQIKSETEIQRTVAALRLAEKAFSQLLAIIRPNMTEKAVAWELEKRLRESGAQGLSFPVIVASGPNSALPHAVPTERRLQRGEPILIDWGARLDAYCSDTTRTLVIGEPDDTFRKVFDTVVTARNLAIEAIAAGASGTAVDRVARDYIDQHGFADKFGHGLGHGTGLAIHEAPRLSPIKDNRLQAGMIVTVEPGIYLPGWGGVRMENQVVIRNDGAQVLNDPAAFDPVLTV